MSSKTNKYYADLNNAIIVIDAIFSEMKDALEREKQAVVLMPLFGAKLDVAARKRSMSKTLSDIIARHLP